MSEDGEMNAGPPATGKAAGKAVGRAHAAEAGPPKPLTPAEQADAERARPLTLAEAAELERLEAACRKVAYVYPSPGEMKRLAHLRARARAAKGVK